MTKSLPRSLQPIPQFLAPGLLLLAACSGASGDGASIEQQASSLGSGPGSNFTMTTTGDDPTGMNMGVPTPQPFGVTLTYPNGKPVVGYRVDFQIASGHGSLSATSVPTDASGHAETTLTLDKSATATSLNGVVA